MCTMQQCQQHIGQWVRFQTPLGYHRGVVEQVRGDAALMRVPRAHAPVGLATYRPQTARTDEQKIDAVLAQWGYGAPGVPGNRPPYPSPYRPPYGAGWWAGAWWFWWIPFFAILALAFLW